METESIIDHEKAYKLLDVIRTTLLPNLEFNSITAWGGEHTKKANSVSLKLSASHSLFKGSYLDVPVPSGLIHYTTIDSLLKILKSKKIRLSSLDSVDDLHEYGFARKALSSTDYEPSFNFAKRNIFALSLCSEQVEKREKSLNMWRNYAADGKGVGIVFRIKSRNRWNWYKFHLSKVFYGDRHLKNLTRFQLAYENFKAEFQFSCSNIGEALNPIFAFHKAPIYAEENEYRMIYIHENEHDLLSPRDDFEENKRHLDLTLENEIVPSMEIKKNIKKVLGTYQNTIYQPKIEISKVYFGYRLSQNDCKELTSEILNYTQDYNHKPILERSTLTKYF